MASNFELSDEQPAAMQPRRPRDKGQLFHFFPWVGPFGVKIQERYVQYISTEQCIKDDPTINRFEIHAVSHYRLLSSEIRNFMLL